MAAGLSFFKLSFLLSLLSGGSDLLLLGPGSESGHAQIGKFPPSCNRIECPSYELVHSGNGYEIRRYNTSVWVSTKPIQDISLVAATRTAFFQLFAYIQGKNEYHQKIEMTAPVISQVLPSDGPFCKSSFVVSFYVPKKNQPDPAPAENLHIQKWTPRYVAVRQFSGFVSDDSVGQEAAALDSSLKGTAWANAIEKSKNEGGVGSDSAYTVAQYNSPFEFTGRVNEIWLPFEMDV
ncbi:PREDICTED: heme-binding protein 2-like [Camelina sativa]|uniref:Heme-binding protein 2-like n=1 Tax=Camelina sativa TaxID=90675 RepID=A0ABM0VPJ9_CAMSA|nr:PREDICTED: heme-binding protein 2-like [Camelina sativa]